MAMVFVRVVPHCRCSPLGATNRTPTERAFLPSILFGGFGFRARLNNGYFLVCKSTELVDDLVNQTVGRRQSVLDGPQNGQGIIVLG